MEAENRKLILIRFLIFPILAIILFWPFFLFAQASVTLNPPSAGCLGSEAFVNLTWTSTISGNPTYFVLRKIQGELSFTEIASTQNTYYTNKPVNSDKNYVYQIKAVKGALIATSTEQISPAVYCPPVLLPPTTSCAVDGPHINLSWSAISGSLSTYEIYRDSIKIGQTLNTNFTDGPNIEGTKTYNYFIRAIWQDGTATSSETVPKEAPACPPTLTVTTDCLTTSPGGPKNNLSWNSLLGIQNYQIYRKAQAKTTFSLLQTVTTTNYTDNLVEGLPTYWQGGQISYYVKAVWLTDQKDSEIKQITIPRCSPYLTIETNCDEFSFRLSWTATLGATHYNIYRNGQFLYQNIGITATNYIDYLNLDVCPGQICTPTYYIEAIVTGFPNFPSNSVEKSIDCATIVPPSPAPVLDSVQAYCVSGDSTIKISWSPSNNVTYYGLYRNGVNIINLLETSYVDSGVESGIGYTYYVVAYGKGGTSVISTNTQTQKAVSCIPPSASTVSLSPSCENGAPIVNLSWTETTNTEKYEIWQGPSATNLSLLITFDKTAPEFISRTWKDTGVSVSTVYYYRVVSKGPTGVTPTNSANTPGVTTSSCLPTTPVLTLTPACVSGNPVVNLSWATDAANTTRYEIFRQDWSLTSPIKIIYDTSIKNWQDTSVAPEIPYNYKVEAVGYLDTIRSTEGYKSIPTYNCAPPGLFTLSEPTVYCQGSYPKADLSWTVSSNATSYDLNRLLTQPTTFSNVTSPFIDLGFGNALSFDGSNDYVTVPSSDSLRLTTGMTLEAWVYPRGFSDYQTIILKQRSNGHNYTLYIVYGRVVVELYIGGSYYEVQDSNQLPLNRWSHIVGTYNGSSLRIYVNGNEINSRSVSGNISVSTGPLRFGGNTIWGEYLDGLIDQVRVYNRAISTIEAQEHYQGIYTNDSGLVGAWHFDEGTGQTVSDSSNYGNNGYRGSSISSNPSDPSWIQSGLQSGANYQWQIQANGPGGSTLSNITNPNTIPLCLPTKPGLVLTTFCEAGTGLPAITLRWSYSINTTKYEIYRQDIGLIKTINQTDPEFISRTWTDNNGGLGLSETKSYTYYVKAIGGGGENQSDSILVTTPSCLKPSQPQILTINFACGGTGNSYPRVRLSWSTSTNATSYTIYRTPPLSVTTALTSYTDTAVTVNTTYSYYVIAYGPGPASDPSDATSTTTGYCPPSIPSITALTTGCESLAPVNTISWSDATIFNTFEYRIYRNTINSPPATPIKTIASTTPEFSSRIWKDNSVGLSPLTTYYYWVKAAGPAGESSYSSSRSVPTYSCQPPPAPNLNFENRCTDSNHPITILNWNKTFETTQYRLYKNGVNFKNFTPSSGYYFRDWLLIGPFSYTWPYDVAFNTDYIGGEITVRPRAGESADGKTWFEHQSSGNFINFNNIFSPNNYVIAYAFTYIYSPVSQSAQLRVGSDDGVKVFLNGSQVWSNYVWRGASPDQDIININLLAGINTLLIKVQEGDGDWGFYARITNTAGNDILANITNWDSSAVTGISANYYVVSIGPGGTSTPSNIVTSNPLNCLPAKPDLVITPQCDGTNPQLKLSWQNDPNTLSWTIHKKREGGTWDSPPFPITTTNVFYLDGDIESDVNYDYYVTAVGKGAATSSDAITKLTPFCYNAPYGGLPFPISATSTCFGYSVRNKIEWQLDPTGKTISYNIWRKNITLGETDFFQIYSGLSADTIQYLNYLDIVEGNTYVYKVEAVGSGAGNTVFSNPSDNITSYECTKIPPFPPTLYLNLVYSVDHKIEVSIGWTDAGNEEEYKVFRSGSSFILIATTSADVLNYTDDTVTDGQTYEYQVMASNVNGNTLSNIITVEVPIARPGDFTLSGFWVASDKIYLTWTVALTTPAGGPVTYEIQRSNSDIFSFYTVLYTTTTPVDFPKDTILDCYDNSPTSLAQYYRAKATNNAKDPTYTYWRARYLPDWKEIAPW